MADESTLRIELTPEQRQQTTTREEVRPRVLRIEELEERVAPVMFNPKEY